MRIVATLVAGLFGAAFCGGLGYVVTDVHGGPVVATVVMSAVFGGLAFAYVCGSDRVR